MPALPADMQVLLLAVALAMPWLMIPALAIRTRDAGHAPALCLAALPAVMAAAWVPDGTLLALPDTLGGWVFALDATGRAFLAPAAIVWALAAWLAASLAPRQVRSPAFSGLWLLGLGGNFAVILAQDLLALYAGLALMTVAGLGLVAAERTMQAVAAARVYMGMMLVAELAMFVAVATLVGGGFSDAGFDTVRERIDGPVLALLGIAFGIKLGALGVHAWLPLAHPVAPVPASAVLSGLMIKSGALGWLRLVEPAGDAGDVVAHVLLWTGFAASLYGVARGLHTKRAKTLLAWSSVSQMGLVTMLAGLWILPGTRGSGLADPVAFAIAVFVVHHGLAKAALFLGAGLLERTAASRRSLVWVSLGIPALALAAAPGTSGVLAKSALEQALAASGQAGWIVPVLYLSGTATVVLMARLLWLTRSPHDTAASSDTSGVRGPALALPWVAMLAAVLVVPWLMLGSNTAGPTATAPRDHAKALVPFVLAGFAASLTWWAGRRVQRRLLNARLPRVQARAVTGLPAPVRRLSLHVVRGERWLHLWESVGLTLIVVAAVLAAALSLG